MNTAEPHTLTGAYALWALPEAERRDFERHLGGCEPCAVEVRALSETATRLGLAMARTPPPELRERVLREITTVGQESPSNTPPTRTTEDAANRAGRGPGVALAACPAADDGFGGIAVRQDREARTARADARTAQLQNSQPARVLAAPDADAECSHRVPDQSARRPATNPGCD